MKAAAVLDLASARRPSLGSAHPVPEVKPTVADVEAQVAQFQIQLAHSFHDARDLVSTILPGPIGAVVNDALYVVRQLLLPAGEHVGMHGTAECVAAKDCSGKDLTGAQHHDEDLSGVDFTGADLTHANFRNANFSPSATAAGPVPAATTTVTANAVIQPGADLSGANLQGADLRGANMTGANLSGANLSNANLTGAIFTKANLTGAILTGANLSGANLTWASLVNANLSGTDPNGAYFGGANLTGAIGTIASSHFQVQLGTVAMSVQQVSGLDVEPQPIEYRASNSPVFSTIKMPGITKLGSVTIKNGVFTSGDKFWDWFNKIAMNTSTRETLTVILLDESGQPAMTWTLTNAFPTKITGLISQGNEMAFASVEIAHEGMKIAN